MNSVLLRQALEKKGWKPEMLATKIKMSSSTIWNMLSGRHVSQKTLEKVSKVLSLDMTELKKKPRGRKPARRAKRVTH